MAVLMMALPPIPYLVPFSPPINTRLLVGTGRFDQLFQLVA